MSDLDKKIVKGKFPKFRIWDANKKKFYYSGDTLVVNGKGNSLVVPFAIPMDYEVGPNFVVNITEFTGMLESTPNMTPIYTGDIVVTTQDGKNPIEKKVVKWVPEEIGFNISKDFQNFLSVVIIGNVFQPPAVEKPALDLSTDIGKAERQSKKLPN